MLKHGNFAQTIEVKTLKPFDYQKAEERKRLYHDKEPIGLDTQFLPFIDLFNKTKTSNRTTIVGWNLGYVLCNDDSVYLCKLQVFKVKALQFITHCVLEAREI